MTKTSEIRTYDPVASVVFQKTKERFGGLSNMASGFPLEVNGIRIRTSEALYQACRFPHKPEVQRRILDERSPMTAKMHSKLFREESRADWDAVRVKIMRWCLRIKLAQNWREFGRLLLATEDRDIVERSRRDAFWGAKVSEDGTLVGINALGRLLRELRQQLKAETSVNLRVVKPLSIPEFLLFSKPIETVCGGEVSSSPSEVETLQTPHMAKPIPCDSLSLSLFDREKTNDIREDMPGPYPSYRDSGQPWLGRIPAHWKVLPGRACFREKKQPNFALQEKTVLSLSYGQIVVKPPEKLHGLVPSSFETYQIVNPLDIVIRPTDLQNDWNSLRFGLSRHRGIITSAYLCFRTVNHVLPEYGHLLLHSYDLMKIFYGLGSGLRQNLDWSDFKHLPFSIPSLPEQVAAVRFLDHADRRIQRYIRAKQKLIALLEEQKQAIIHQAVTGQIDARTGQPYPSYKDSGVEWLGDVPEHWEVVPLRRVSLDSCDGPFGSGLKSSHYSEQGVRVVRLQNIGHGEFKDSDAAFISPEYYSSLRDHSVISGDVLIAGLGDNNHPAGRACVAPGNIIPAMVKADCFRFRLNQARIQPRFAALQLTATAIVVSALLSTGATRQRTNLQATCGRAIGIPSVAEQNLIVKYITAKLSGIGRTQVAVQREIELLREYRTRLIADVVTGKLDVRDAAVRLPVEANNPRWESLPVEACPSNPPEKGSS